MFFHAINVIILASISFINSELIEMSCAHIKQFIDGHNKRRMLLTEGEIENQPKAAVMYHMIWDKELSQKAADWAGRNRFAHNIDSTVASRRFITGENIHMTLTTDPKREFRIEEALKSWWSENENFEYQRMNENHFKSKEKQVGHYTQMAWANTIYLGCAVSVFQKGKWNTFLVVCYYGPAGNIIHEYPYTSGGEYGVMLKCHKKKKSCVDMEYGGGDCSPNKFANILRVSTIMDLDAPDEKIKAAAGAVGASEQPQQVELHENLMSISLPRNYTPIS